MPTLEEFRSWLRGKRVKGLPRNKAKPAPIASPSYRTSQFIVNDDGDDAILSFGGNIGKSISQLAKSPRGRSYIRWILKNDFPEELKSVCRYRLKKRG